MKPIAQRLAMALMVTPMAVMAACSSTQAGQPSPEPTPGPSTPTDTTQPGTSREHSKAPPVKQPLDAAKYIAAPCSSITNTQLKKFGGSGVGEVESHDSGPACVWRVGPNTDTSIGISFATAVKTGLSNIYALNDTRPANAGYFEPTEVNGYPAAYNGASDNRSRGDCGLSVGIRDELFFSIDVQSRAGNDSCAAAKNVASEVIKTIRGGS